ncbi:MAG: hypothetical protein Kow0010_12810 [Dehalococcoidia bacterium]
MKEALRRVLAAYEPQQVEPGPGARDAAVLLLLYERSGEPHIVFQKRTHAVEHHKGQISLPGGAIDPDDPGHDFAALRETHEEIGVHPSDVELLGRLDDVVTVATNYRVRPFVGWFVGGYGFRHSEREVAYLLEVPLSHLARPETLVPDVREIDGRRFVLPAYRFGEELIWGATARVLTNFLDLYRAIERELAGS